MKKVNCFILFVLLTTLSYSQEKDFSDWNLTEKNNYKTLKGLAEYVHNKDSLKISKKVLFDKYIYFDNVLNDTVLERKTKRMNAFDGLFKSIPKTIDSLGINNLDAKPIRFYKNHEIHKPFKKALSSLEKDAFAYYLKESPNKPIGVLLFESDSGKLISWILLRQGDSGWHFLTFNLL